MILTVPFLAALLFLGLGNCVPDDKFAQLIDTDPTDKVVVKRHTDDYESREIVGYLPDDIDFDGIKLIRGNNLLIFRNGQLHTLEILNDDGVSNYVNDKTDEDDDGDLPEERGLRKRKRFRRRNSNDKIRRSRRRNNKNRRRQNTRRKNAVKRNSKRGNNKNQQNDGVHKRKRIASNSETVPRRRSAPFKKRRTQQL